MPAAAEKVKNTDEEPRVLLSDESKGKEQGEEENHQKDTKGEKEQTSVDQKKVDRVIDQLHRELGIEEDSSQAQLPREAKVPGEHQILSDSRVEVFKSEDDKYFVSGVTSLDKEHLQNIFEEQGISLQIEFPKDWNKRSSPEKRSWFRKQGIEVIPAIAGGAGDNDNTSDWLEKLPDSSEVSSDLANYIREIEKIGKGESAPQDKYSALQNIDENLTSALVKGEITADEASINQVQEALSKGLSATGRQTLRDSRGASYMEDELGRVPMFEKNQLEINAKEACDKLLSFAKEGKASGAEWDEALKNVKEMVQQVKDLAGAPEPKNYGQAHNITKGIRDAIARNIDGFDKLPDETIRNELKSAEIHLKTLDHKFQALLNSKNKQEPHALVGDIDSDAALYLKQITAGYGVGIDRAKRSIWQRAQGEDPQGIREWRALRSIE